MANQRQWTYHNPTKIVFGDGAPDGIGDLIAGRHYVLVTYDQAPFKEMTAPVQAAADQLEALISNLGVGASPTVHGVAEGEWKDLVCDALVGERGRSFLDDSNHVLNGL